MGLETQQEETTLLCFKLLVCKRLNVGSKEDKRIKDEAVCGVLLGVSAAVVVKGSRRASLESKYKQFHLVHVDFELVIRHQSGCSIHLQAFSEWVEDGERQQWMSWWSYTTHLPSIQLSHCSISGWRCGLRQGANMLAESTRCS